MGALLNLKRCICLLSVLFVDVHSESYYQVFPLEADRLCSLGFVIPPNSVEVGKDSKSGLLIENRVYFNSLSGKYPFNCQFKVKATQDKMGLFAVIQRMRLRKDKTTGECIDYVQFRHTSSFQIGPVSVELENVQDEWGKKHCGHVIAKDVDFTELNPTDQSRTLPYAFIDPKGKVDVRIYIRNESRMLGEILDLKIAFTSYYICSSSISSTYKKCGGDSCIFHKYFNDGILNCPFTTCVDENGCNFVFEAGIKPSAGLATKVMVGAVAGVFSMFIAFFVFLWLFRHCTLCCSDAVSSAQNTTQMRPIPTMEDAQPTAPPRTPTVDKDLPPSYESLFPNA